MIPFSIIVAVDSENGIGRDGDLPWHLPADLKHFKEISTKTSDPNKQNIVAMGRKTWDSIPEKFRPLPDRCNIVLTRNSSLSLPDNVQIANGLDQIDSLCNESIESVFIIGGQQIFEEVMKLPQCTKIYMTHIDQSFDCDTFFPSFIDDFNESSSSESFEYESISYRFVEYTRK